MPIIEFAISIVFVLLFSYSLFKYKNKIAAFFALTCLFIAIYSFGYALELLSGSRQQLEFALNIEIFGLVFIPTFWILISSEFYNNKASSYFANFIIFSIPLLTLFLFSTNQFHHLYYSQLIVVQYHNYSTAHLVKGLWYYVFITYTYLGFLFSFFVFYCKWKEAAFSLKTQAFWMLLGSVCPAAAYIFYIIDLVPTPYDLTTFGFAFLALCCFIAIFKYDFLELNQIARERVFDEISEGIIVIDHKLRIIDYNQAGKDMFSWLNKQSIGKNIMLFPEGNEICKNTSFHFTFEVMKKNRKIYLGFSVTPIFCKNILVGKILIFQDITEQTSVLEKLNKLATNDSLTGVFNRRKLMEESEKEHRKAYLYGNDLSALMIDIDFFKRVNDTYGHLAGDKVITSLANVCKKRLRKSDIIGRYGGEEFLILLPNTNLDEALLISEDIRSLIEQTEIDYENKQIKVKVSIGVSSTSLHSEPIPIMNLINESDQALYKAKNTGRNRVCSV